MLLSEKKVVFWPIYIFFYFHFHPKQMSFSSHYQTVKKSEHFEQINRPAIKWCHSFPKVAIHHYVLNGFSSLNTFLLCGSVVYCNSNTLRSLTLKERLVLLKNKMEWENVGKDWWTVLDLNGRSCPVWNSGWVEYLTFHCQCLTHQFKV